MALSLHRISSHSFISRYHTYMTYLPISFSTIHHHHHRHYHQNKNHFLSTFNKYNSISFQFPHIHNNKYYQSNIPKQPQQNNKKLFNSSLSDNQKQSIRTSKEKLISSKITSISKYLNPLFILTKTFTIISNIIYYTFDSIIHPLKGYERLSNIWKSIKHHASHFWEACKLMWTDIGAAWKILLKFLKTGELTYRERRQLRRVTMDVLRFVPMFIIVAIPFLEVGLPFLLYCFPNMLPSRFQTEHQKIEKRKKLLTARLGLTAFFEDTLLEFVKETKSKQDAVKLIGNEKLQSLEKLLEKIKNNEEISNNSILKLASLFDDEMALDNASASVLSNMCRYMELNSFGTQPMLRNRLYDKIRQIRKEDQGIRKEGLDNIPLQLLKTLLRERGMRSDFEEWVLRSNMNKWLELSLDDEVPVTLLIMSRIFTLQHIPGQDPTQMLAGTISSIGEATTKEMLVEKGGMDDLKGEREIIEKQQQLILEEKELKELNEGDELAGEDELKQFEKDKIIEKKRIKQVAEVAETLTAQSIIDPEKQEIEEIREKLKEITEETEALMQELKNIKIEKEYQKIDIKSEIEFDIKEDEMAFIDVQKEMEQRSNARDKITKRIEKWIQKSEKEAEETMKKFVNTLKIFNENDENICEEELKKVLRVGIYSDKEIEEFLKELDDIKQKEPNLNLSQRIEKLIDEYYEDIYIKDIKKYKKEKK
eukprot:391340_1